VYLQNSGLGNTVNPVMSWAHREVYGIPMVLLVGWRGDPTGGHDEPQHLVQGRVTPAMLDSMTIPWKILPHSENEAEEVVASMVAHSLSNKTPVALLVKKRHIFSVQIFRKFRGYNKCFRFSRKCCS